MQGENWVGPQENTFNRNKNGAAAWVQNVSNSINCANKNIQEFLPNNFLQGTNTQQETRDCWKASNILHPFPLHHSQKSQKKLDRNRRDEFSWMSKTPQTWAILALFYTTVDLIKISDFRASPEPALVTEQLSSSLWSTWHHTELHCLCLITLSHGQKVHTARLITTL